VIYAPVSPLEADADRVRRSCTRYLSGHYPLSPKQALLELAEATSDDVDADMYGSGAVIEEFEGRVADLVGMESAVFMPSGTMCQQIAVRIWTQRRGVPTVAMHPRNHLDRPEHFGYALLHGLRGIPVGSADRLLTLNDLDALREPVGTLLLELPQREIGGQLPSWDELVSLTAWARVRGIPVHMDGARLWECQPFYERGCADIAGLFDSVYVSFYKGLGGISGAALAGPTDLISEARIWMRRHGGNLIRLYPYVLSAQLGIDRHLNRMGEYHEKAVKIAAALRDVPDITIVPDSPHTNMMHLYLRAGADSLPTAALDVSTESGVWMGSRFGSSPLPGLQRMELTVGTATLDLDEAEIRGLFEKLLERAAG
jgi:threonine aldolase